ncbi:PREDICTED: uncharacterized protein LOC105360942 [Ceratosolen solmsi marchali]|uniref:Uncharacterized protein LOC105360942 n=1 Tax=Ceratosolen solmsi marchali TaxID=326594 RepID=A0AAJ6YDX4_9HYME|nr:PREDICTED: uncharacterized protein LOC105360942 [Ceratosolen solmsi marchali]
MGYEYGLAKTFNPRDEVKKSGVFMKPPEDLTLEEQYKEFQKMNISEWTNVRIPRPKDWND